MPPRDPRLCPALKRSMPGDSVPGGEIRFTRDPWLILFGDGQWHQVEVRAWRKDRHGRVVVDIEWRIQGEMWGESYVADAERMREA